MLLGLLERCEEAKREYQDLRKKIDSFNNKEWQNILYKLNGREYRVSLYITTLRSCPFKIYIQSIEENNSTSSYKLYANLRAKCEVVVDTPHCLHIFEILEIVNYFEEELVDLLKY